MCFSVEASFGSAGLVGVVGAATLAKVRHLRELPLGALPMMFALHQLDEGTVWLALEGRMSPGWTFYGAWLYILFAQSLLPAIVPWCIWLVEPDKKRRWCLAPLMVVGIGLCGFALWKLATGHLSAQIQGHGIEYETPLNHLWWFFVLYALTTCVPLFLSSYPWMLMFAVLNVVALCAVLVFKSAFLTTVWCLFAAVLSLLIYMHFHRVRSPSYQAKHADALA